MIDFGLLQEYLGIYFKNIVHYIKQNNGSLFFIVIFIIILVSIALYISFNIKNKTNLDKLVDVNELAYKSDDFNTNNTTVIYMFYTDWCPVCIRASPEWDKFVSKIESKDKIKHQKINCESDKIEHTKLVEKYNIKAYPTILLLHKGTVYEYTQQVTSENLLKFVNDIIENN